MDHQKAGDPTHPTIPNKQVHVEPQVYRCDNHILSRHATASSITLTLHTSLKSRSHSPSKPSRLYRFNTKHFVETANNILYLRDTFTLKDSLGIRCKYKLNTLCAIPGTSLCLYICEDSTVGVADILNSRAKSLQTVACERVSSMTMVEQNLIVCCYDFGKTAVLKVSQWDYQDLRMIHVLHSVNASYKRVIAFSPENIMAESYSQDQLLLHSLQKMKKTHLSMIQGSIYCLHKCSQNVVAFGGNLPVVQLFDVRCRRVVSSLPADKLWVGSISQISDTRVLYSNWNTLVDVDLRMGQISSMTGHSSGIWSIELCNAERVLTCSSDGIINVWAIG